MAQIKGEVFHNYVSGSQNLESCNLLEESFVVMHNGAREELKNADSLNGGLPAQSEIWSGTKSGKKSPTSSDELSIQNIVALTNDEYEYEQVILRTYATENISS